MWLRYFFVRAMLALISAVGVMSHLCEHLEPYCTIHMSDENVSHAQYYNISLGEQMSKWCEVCSSLMNFNRLVV